MESRLLGHYRVKTRLGAGGMGEVFRVEDTKLGRDVALKVLRPEFAADQDRLRRFRREAQVLAGLDHPGIVTIFSVEESDGTPFLTMQLVPGDTLDRLVPATGLPLSGVIAIAVPLVDAVAAAHDRGIVHRDLKPSNVMVTPQGVVKVLDFGLAQVVAAPSHAAAETISRDGQIAGTLPYMSPEQVSGMPVDQRSDVFSLGALLYEMVTGRRRFEGATPVEVMSAILTGGSDLRPAPRECPPALIGIIERCLEREAAKRFASARELHRALQSLDPDDEAPAPARRPTRASIAVLPFTSLSADPEDAFFADGTSEEIINALGRLPDVKVAARTSAFSFRGTSEDLRAIGAKLGVGTILEGSVRRAGRRLRISTQLVDVTTGYHLWSERYDRELVDVFEIQEDIARSIAARLTDTLTARRSGEPRRGTQDLEAFRLNTQGRALAEQCTAAGLQAAVPCFQGALERDGRYALAWSGLADALLLLEDYQIVERGTVLPAARTAVDRALELDPNLAEAHASRGLMQGHLRESPAAMAAFRRAVELRPGYAAAHNWLAWAQLLSGDRAGALHSAERSVELNPLASEPLSNLALALTANGRPEEGRRAARRVCEIEPAFETGIFYEAVALYAMERFDDAAALLNGVSITWSPSAPTGLKGLTEFARGQPAAGRRCLRELHAQEDLAGAALLHAACGEIDEAFEAFDRVDRWTYWSTLAYHNFLEPVLAPLRTDPRFPSVDRAVRRSWGLDGAGHSREEDS